jgi:chemotaxis protein methyltransferase CheR
MLIRDHLDAIRAAGADPVEFSILATDVSAVALAKAASGVYDHWELSRGVSPAVLQRHFQKRGRHWIVREPVRRLVEFRRINLIEPVTALGIFDAIFCRNLLIYFDEATRRRLCGEFHAMLPPGGWLMLGTAENLYGVSERFESVRLGETLLYRR